MRARAWTLAVVACAAAACGTTVSSNRLHRGANATGGVTDNGLAAPSADAGAPGAASAPSGGSAVPGSVPSGASAAAVGSGGATPDAAAAAGSIPPGGSAPGVTASTISVGMPYILNSNQSRAAAGVGGVSNGDQQTEWQILVNDINARGGIAGRKVVPVFYAIDATSSQTYAQQAQAECAAYTEDHHVFAVLEGGDSTFEQCAAQHGAVDVYENLTLDSAATFRRYPALVQPGTLNLDRMAADLVASLVGQQYFSPWSSATAGPGQLPPKVGVLVLDHPDFAAAMKSSLLPALAQAGFPHPDVFAVAPNKSTADLATPVAQLASAELRFHADGVTHVIVFESSGLLFFFAQTARTQGYYPRYGITTQSGAELLLSTGNMRAADVRGAMGVGWMPMIDLQASDNPLNGPASNDARRACVALMRTHGQTLPDPVAERSALNFCDELHFLKAAVEAGGSTISRSSFLAGVAALHTSFVDANTFGTSFSATQHDGVALVRSFAFQATCSCFRYTSGPVPG